jgi:hypothetical protein
MHKSATKCNETLGKWCKNKHGASKIIDTLETYQAFSTFFALANADLWDFSVVVFAVVAASQAFLEASSLASRDEMRALAAAKSSVAQEGERKLNKRVTEAQR